jgi:hypothetical protein
MSTADIPVSNPLHRSHTLPMSLDSLCVRGALLPIDHFLYGLARYHYLAYRKILLVCSLPLGFSSRTNIVLLPKGVTNKTKSNEARHPPLAKQALCPIPH